MESRSVPPYLWPLVERVACLSVHRGHTRLADSAALDLTIPSQLISATLRCSVFWALSSGPRSVPQCFVRSGTAAGAQAERCVWERFAQIGLGCVNERLVGSRRGRACARGEPLL